MDHIPTLSEDTLRIVDNFWAKDLGCSREQLRAGQTLAVPHPDQYVDFLGIFILLIGGAPIISLPRELYSSLSAEMQRWPASRLFDDARLRELMGDRVDKIIGPVFIGYTERGMFRATSLSGATVLDATHAAAVSSLRAACDPVEWAHGGRELGVNRSTGVFADKDLVALAGYDLWDERIAHISIVTHPGYRRRGHGCAAVSKLTESLLQQNLIPQYRTLDSNHFSLRIAAKLGFPRYATSITVRFAPNTR